MAVIPNTKNSIDGGQVVAKPKPVVATPVPTQSSKDEKDARPTPAPAPAPIPEAEVDPRIAAGERAAAVAKAAAEKAAADAKAAADKAAADKKAADQAEADKLKADSDARIAAGKAAQAKADADAATAAQQAKADADAKAAADAAIAAKVAAEKALEDARLTEKAAADSAALKADSDARMAAGMRALAVADPAAAKALADKAAADKAEIDANAADLAADKLRLEKEAADKAAADKAETDAAKADLAADIAAYKAKADASGNKKVTQYVDQFGTVRDLDPDFNQIPFDSLADNIKNNVIKNAAIMGITPEAYYAMRGGVNMSGYYGDAYGIHSVEGVSLTDDEYQQAIAGKSGAEMGAAINAARAAKIKAKTGNDPAWLQQAKDDAEKNGVPFTATTTTSSTSTTTTTSNTSTTTTTSNTSTTVIVPPENTTNNPDYTTDDPKIVPPVIVPGGTTTVPGAKTDAELAREDAFAQMKDVFNSYGLGSLGTKIEGYMKDNKGPNETVLLLKQSDEYNKRFNGNVQRAKAGLNVVSEAEYIALENSYSETLKAYGLTSMLSNDRVKNETLFASYIGADIAPTEFKNRIDLTIMRVQNADPTILKTLKTFYPSLEDADLVSYFLNPADSLPRLQQKVTAGEIGAAAVGQGLNTNEATAAGLAAYGVDRQAALQGYSNIAEMLPGAQKLSSIYNEADIKYGQAQAEAEVFKGNQDAASKRKRLASMERAAFSGSSGVSNASLGQSTQGNF